MISMCMYLVVGTAYMGYMVGFGTCLAFFIGFISVGVFLIAVFKARIFVETNYMKVNDKRVAILKNVIQNISYVKMRAWENFYAIRIFR